MLNFYVLDFSQWLKKFFFFFKFLQSPSRLMLFGDCLSAAFFHSGTMCCYT